MNATTSNDHAHDADIVVAGAGPVGTCLAIEAARRGAKVTVIEPRAAGEPPSAKCNTVAARTLETFRRFGVADKVRAAGLPDDYPTDVIYTTSLAGPEMTRIALPSRNERHLDGFIDSHWQTPEPMVRISQIYLEPILFAAMAATPGITLVNAALVERYDQTDGHVTAHCRRTADDTPFTVTGTYLVGCDGGRSTIRKQMGARLVGDAELGRTRSSLVRSTQIRGLFGDRRPAWMSWIANHRIRGNVVAIDGEDLWLLHRAMPNSHMAYDDLDFHQSILDLLGVDEVDYEVINHEDWTGRRLVADRFRDGNVFIAGDAAHLWVPFAGYGMNAGIADGVHLAWLLASVIDGWADSAILDAYEAERLPITEQVSRHAMAKVLENVEAIGGNTVPEVLSELTDEGEQLRAMFGTVLYDVNVPQFAPEGLNFGYFYERSPIIVSDGSIPADYTMGSITPSTVPGCRMPAFDVGGTPVLDLLGGDYTLLRFDPTVDIDALTAAAERDGLPLAVLDAERPSDPAFTTALLLVRYDQHVVWRGDAAPDDSSALVATLRGAGR